MTFTFSETPSLVRYLYWKLMWGTPKRIARSLFLTYLLPISFWGLLFTVNPRFSVPWTYANVIAILAGAIAWAALFNLLMSEWAVRHGVKLARRSGPEKQLAVADDGIVITAQDSEARIKWAAITLVQETPRGFLMFRSGRPFVFLPIEAVPPELQDSFRREIGAKARLEQGR